MMSARTTRTMPKAADSGSRLEYSINLSAGDEALDGLCPVVSSGQRGKR